MGLHAYIRVGAGHVRGARDLGVNILADIYEAVMGALYLDGGLVVVRRAFEERLSSAIGNTQVSQDFKSQLQVAAARMGLGVPVYAVEGSSGPDHARIFECVVLLQGKVCGKGIGSSTKTAEQKCAKEALSVFGIGPHDS